MKLRGVVCCAVLAVAGITGAHAQTAACKQLPELMSKTLPQLKVLQGAQIEDDKDEITRAFKTMLDGFQECKLSSAKAIDSISDYWDHHLWCDGTSSSSEAANLFVEGLWACTKDTYTERRTGEAFIDGRYRMISFEGEAPIAGRSAGLVDFGETEYARVVFEKSHDMSKDYDMHIYWSFKQQ